MKHAPLIFTKELPQWVFDIWPIFLPTQRVIVTPLARTVDSVTIQPGSVHVSPTSEVFSVTAVQKIWWAFPRVSSVTVMQMVPDSCLVLPTECVTVQPRSVRGMIQLELITCFLVGSGEVVDLIVSTQSQRGVFLFLCGITFPGLFAHSIVSWNFKG